MIYAYHFVPANMKLAHSGEPVELDHTYRVEGKIVPPATATPTRSGWSTATRTVPRRLRRPRARASSATASGEEIEIESIRPPSYELTDADEKFLRRNARYQDFLEACS